MYSKSTNQPCQELFYWLCGQIFLETNNFIYYWYSMSDWYSDYKRFPNNWEDIGFMTGSQANRLAQLSRQIDGYATIDSLEEETNRAISVEQEIINVLDGYGMTFVDGYINLDGYASKTSLQSEVTRAITSEQQIRDGYTAEIIRAINAELELNIALGIFDGYTTISNELYPNSIIWWSSNPYLKIKEVTYIRNVNNQPTSIVTKLYKNGVLFKTITDTITYNGIIELSRNRSIL